jgi:hypothetical protein
MKTWMERLASEGIVGADSIFACLGPALEIFSQYAKVEKVNGDLVELSEYLEHVWSAIAQEALSLIFDGADLAGLEEDARITAMWLWTLSAETKDAAADGDKKAKTAKRSQFILDFDAARKIAQGLGANLESMDTVVQLRGDKARLLDVAERARTLFPKGPGAKKSKGAQRSLFEDVGEAVAGWTASGAGVHPGQTELDRVHQSMLLFASGRSDALSGFLSEDAVGRRPSFWKLSQSLSALYPVGSDEKRWVDGVLARKKGLGFG